MSFCGTSLRSIGAGKKRTVGAAERNREPIWSALADVFASVPGAVGRVLEIASGTGTHVAHFAAQNPDIQWFPTDPDSSCLESIQAWTEEEHLPNVAAPAILDVTADDWPVEGPFDAAFCANMIHIAPWECCEGLFRGCSKVLRAGAPLCIYGPFCENGVYSAPSNAAFNDMLRERDSRWGVRDLVEVTKVAEAAEFRLRSRHELPANNLLLVFEKQA